MKLPNKEAKASAEAAEGRARTKENDVHHHTYPTQSGIRVSQGLGGVRRTAQARKQERFTALLHHLTVGLLRESYYALKRSAAPVVDGASWQEYEHDLEERLISLHQQVHRGVYRAQPSRRVYIPKADGRQRPSGNTARLGRFRDRLCTLWAAMLGRRSHRSRPSWKRIRPTFERWIPRPRVLHPYPEARFDAIHPR